MGTIQLLWQTMIIVLLIAQDLVVSAIAQEHIVSLKPLVQTQQVTAWALKVIATALAILASNFAKLSL